MAEVIVHSIGPVILVGGAQLGPDDLNILSTQKPKIVAVDGGADHLHAAGVCPDAVIGDLDSISAGAKLAFADVLHHVGEQDTVDFEKALLRIDAPQIIAVGFSGGRLDRSLAVLHAMGRHRDRSVILAGADDVAMIVPAAGLQLRDLPLGCRLSLMPLAKAHVHASGLQWPIDAQMHPLGLTSPSNAVAEAAVQITADGPVLVILPRAHVDRLLITS